MLRPAQGPVIPGSGGLRKVRWARLTGAASAEGCESFLLLAGQASRPIYMVYAYSKCRAGRLDAGADSATRSAGTGGVSNEGCCVS